MTTWNLNGTKHHVLICNGSSCMKKGGEEATQAIREKVSEMDADSVIHTTRTRCNGRCKDAPVAIVYPEGIWYKQVTPGLAHQIVEEHLVNGNVISEMVIYDYKKNGFVAPENSDSIKGVDKVESKA
ncbi:(2Fe-2S) ferredoxin domain-containing protein [Priestia megaterium]|nr:(2Fe-2S) ferredoxin domain-containing protein [Priestia megaterium]